MSNLDGIQVKDYIRIVFMNDEEGIQMEIYTEIDVENDSDTSETESDTSAENEPLAQSMYRQEARPSLKFNDGTRSVDFVLVWTVEIPGDYTSLTDLVALSDKRQIFERNLIKEGLDVEVAEEESSLVGLNFLKIYAPKDVLRRYSEILNLRMPMKEIPGLEKTKRRKTLIDMIPYANNWIHSITRAFKENFVHLNERVFPSKPKRLTAVYSRDKEYLFDIEAEDFFTSSIRSRIVQFILDRKAYTEDIESDPFAFGIKRLIKEGMYIAAYPLHDGNYRHPTCLRHNLYLKWACMKNIIKQQPLDYIKEYFGVQIGLYFAWLGFYTFMLLPAAIVGLACFVYGIMTLSTNIPSQDICNETIKEKMCPLCDHFCHYWDLKETCLQGNIEYIFDNFTTIFFAIFMSFWAAMFKETWKRYSAEIKHRWDLTAYNIKEEHPRPEYLAKLSNVKTKEVNVITDAMEPVVPFWTKRIPTNIMSFSIVFLLVALAGAGVTGVVLYRMSMLTALSIYGENIITGNAILFTIISGASLNLCAIMVFNLIYTVVAERLTELELWRTQTEFDESLTLKIYLLQFVNYYTSIFYIAFFKGKSIGHPAKYSRIFGYRQEECGPGGCLLELSIQLSIIMVGKQALRTMMEVLLPLVMKWINTIKIRKRLFPERSWRKKGYTSPYQWTRDFKLNHWGTRSLFPEYLNMVVQYGFITIFVVAFPLAPLFALLNNILEIRIDAKKLLVYFRRPVSQHVKDIGVWLPILDTIGKLSVLTNIFFCQGFIIAFTSRLIPKLFYIFAVSEDLSLIGYLNFSLSYFDINDFESGYEVSKNEDNITLCRYPDFREPPTSANKYERTVVYWKIMAARLTFALVFVIFISLMMMVVGWIIPEIPKKLENQIRREAYLANEIIIKRETEKALSESSRNIPGGN